MLTTSPATIPWPTAPTVIAASPLTTPGPGGEPRQADLLADRRDRGDELDRGADRALGVVLVGDRRAPHRHDRIADELLDRPAVPGDDRPADLEVAGEQLLDLLGIAALGQGRERDEVDEQDRHEAPLGRRRRPTRRPGSRPARRGTARRRPGGVASAASRPRRTIRRTGTRGRSGAAQAGQRAPRALPHEPQNREVGGLSVPQASQRTVIPTSCALVRRADQPRAVELLEEGARPGGRTARAGCTARPRSGASRARAGVAGRLAAAGTGKPSIGTSIRWRSKSRAASGSRVGWRRRARAAGSRPSTRSSRPAPVARSPARGTAASRPVRASARFAAIVAGQPPGRSASPKRIAAGRLRQAVGSVVPVQSASSRKRERSVRVAVRAVGDRQRPDRGLAVAPDVEERAAPSGRTATCGRCRCSTRPRARPGASGTMPGRVGAVDQAVDAALGERRDDPLDRQDQRRRARHVADQRQPGPGRDRVEDRRQRPRPGRRSGTGSGRRSTAGAVALGREPEGVERRVVLVVGRQQLVAGLRSGASAGPCRPGGGVRDEGQVVGVGPDERAERRPRRRRAGPRARAPGTATGSASIRSRHARWTSRTSRGQAPNEPWLRKSTSGRGLQVRQVPARTAGSAGSPGRPLAVTASGRGRVDSSSAVDRSASVARSAAGRPGRAAGPA